ncbi:ABC transporter permease [Chloroflexota bacterium]
MQAYIIRRLLLLIPTLFLVTVIIFLLVQVIPGTAVDLIISQIEQNVTTQENIDALMRAMGVDVPLHVQYGRWLGGILRGDLGNSLWSGRPVLQELLPRIPVSIELGFLAILTGILIALPIGVYSAVRQDTAGDYVARSSAIICLAVPHFWVATMVIVYPSIWWGWTPPIVYIPFMDDPAGNLRQLLLPAVILGMHLTGTSMRMTRTMMLEVLRQDYIRTAWSKGLSERAVILRHALKNALIPVVTQIGGQITVVVGSAVVIEQIFGLPGIGSFLIDAINKRDYIMLSGVNLFVAAGVVLTILAVDLSYAFLDPRVKYK